jgi:transposase
MIDRTVLSIDLAKHILQICIVSKQGEVISNKAVSPDRLRKILAISKPSIVAMEGCGACHYWGRYAEKFGHELRIISPKRVKAFLQGQKTDANDALAIAIAAVQFGMVFSRLKSIDQQTLQTIESSRKLLCKELTAIGNHIRAFIYEYGIVCKRGRKSFNEVMLDATGEIEAKLPVCLKSTLRILWKKYNDTEVEILELKKTRNALVRQISPCKRLTQLEGVGDVCAAKLYASLGDGSGFKNGRAASVYIGLTPKQFSSGGKTHMMGINKKGGDKELRAALFQGAFAVINRLPAEPQTEKQAWLIALVKRAGIKRACIALANKNVRTAWALLTSEQDYKPVII